VISGEAILNIIEGASARMKVVRGGDVIVVNIRTKAPEVTLT